MTVTLKFVSGDVFSFGIIVQEVVLESDPYSSNVPLLEPDEILARVKEGRTIYRPTIPTGEEEISQQRCLAKIKLQHKKWAVVNWIT